MQKRAIIWEQRRELAREAAHVAMETRFELGMNLEEPICAHAACERLGVLVRFVDVNMEGIYLRQQEPRILLSNLRPLVRRHFNCAHELGHHIFGHGTSLDELQENAEAYDDRHPDEFLVDSFAGHLLMPVFGIRRAFSRRRVRAEDAQPNDILAIATEYGVGYETLLTHLKFSLEDITASRRDGLLRARAQFRRAILANQTSTGIVLVDDQFAAPTVDVEVNHLIIAPDGAVANGDIVVPTGESQFGRVFRATRRGVAEMSISGTPWAVTVRVAPERFIGLARFRYLEDDE